MTKRWDAVTVGEIYIDHVFSGLLNWPRPGEEIFTRNYLARTGRRRRDHRLRTGPVWAAGRPSLAWWEKSSEPWIKQRLGEFDVETDGLRQVPGSSGVTVSVSVMEERSFYSYAGSNELLGEYLSSHELVEQLQQAAHVHFAVPLERRYRAGGAARPEARPDARSRWMSAGSLSGI